MAVSAKWYGKALINALGGETAGESSKIDWLSDTINVALFTNAFTPDQDTQESYTGLTNEVAAGGGYTTGGASLANKSVGYTAGTNVIKLDADDVTWAASTITARYAVIYDDTDAAKPVLGYVDFGADVISSNGAFTIIWDAAGIFTITAA